MANYHLVILKKPYLEAILAGRKTIESRFTKTRRAPFGQIYAGDKLFFKESCGLVRAAATATAVKSFKNLSPEKIASLKQRYNPLIAGSDEYWQSKADCSYGFLVWLEGIKAIKPVRIDKKDLRAWVVLTEKENFGLLKMDFSHQLLSAVNKQLNC